MLQCHDLAAKFDPGFDRILRLHFKFQPAAAPAHDGAAPAHFGLRIGTRGQQVAGDLHHLGRGRRFESRARDEGAQRIAAPRHGQRAQRRDAEAVAIGGAREIALRPASTEQLAASAMWRALRAMDASAPSHCWRMMGSTFARRKLRANAFRMLVGSSTQRSRCAFAYASSSAREVPSNGRAMRPGPNGAIARHGGQAGDACAAKQLQQQGFHLIVAMLRGDQHLARLHGLREQRVTRLARGGFGRLAALAFDRSRAGRRTALASCRATLRAVPAQSALAACSP